MPERTPPDAGSGQVQVFVVDDEEQVLNVVRRMLEKAGYRVAAFRSADELLARPDMLPPCCVLLDVNMPGMSGLEAQEKLSGREASPRIVFMSGGSSIPISVQAMKGGAVDFLEKPFPREALLAAVRTAIDASERDFAVLRRRTAARERLDRLTPREREVCEAVVRGLRSREIAAELGAAEKTVNIHRSNAMRKLQVETVAELIALVGESSAPHRA
ncbi:MAG TPA: response regulator [Myxococcales bacterium]|jgi:FixJ family two-component response regulator